MSNLSNSDFAPTTIHNCSHSARSLANKTHQCDFDPEQWCIYYCKQVTTTIDFYPLGCALLIVCTLGIVGNVLSAIVLSKRSMRYNAYSYIALVLAICDTVYLLTKFFRFGLLSFLVEYSLAEHYTNYIFPRVGPEFRAMNFTAQMASTYVTIILAFDRYLAICRPLKAKILCTRRNAQIILCIAILFAFIYNIPRWLEFHTVPVLGNDDEIIGYKMEQLALRHNATYKSLYITWSYFVFINLIPLASMSFFNFRIIMEIRKSNKSLTVLSPNQKIERTLAIVLIYIVAVYLVCNTGFLVTDILDYVGQPYPKFWDQIANFLLTLNFAFNFIVYCACGRKFRNEFVKVFNCKKDSTNNGSDRSTNDTGTSGNVSTKNF